MGGTFERGVSLNSYPKVERMFHATNRRHPYDQPIGDISDVGLHLSPSPNVTDFYALTQATRDTDMLAAERRGELPPGISLAGPRTYPLLVDAGNKFKDFPVDAGHWNNPKDVATQAYMMQPDLDSVPDLRKVLDAMGKGAPVATAFKDLGYDSVLYPHHNFWYPRGDQEDALMLWDPSRVIPEYSTLGGKVKQVRGVLDPKIQSDAPGDMEEFLGDINSSTIDPHEAMKTLWDPTPDNLTQEIMSLNWELGLANPEDKDWVADKLMTKYNELTQVADPDQLEYVTDNIFTKDKKLKNFSITMKPGWNPSHLGPNFKTYVFNPNNKPSVVGSGGKPKKIVDGKYVDED
jgi:hypothetical protein